MRTETNRKTVTKGNKPSFWLCIQDQNFSPWFCC